MHRKLTAPGVGAPASTDRERVVGFRRKRGRGHCCRQSVHAAATAVVGSTSRSPRTGSCPRQSVGPPASTDHERVVGCRATWERTHCLRRALHAATTAHRIAAGTGLLRNEALLLSGATRIRRAAR